MTLFRHVGVPLHAPLKPSVTPLTEWGMASYAEHLLEPSGSCHKPQVDLLVMGALLAVVEELLKFALVKEVFSLLLFAPGHLLTWGPTLHSFTTVAWKSLHHSCGHQLPFTQPAFLISQSFQRPGKWIFSLASFPSLLPLLLCASCSCTWNFWRASLYKKYSSKYKRRCFPGAYNNNKKNVGSKKDWQLFHICAFFKTLSSRY